MNHELVATTTTGAADGTFVFENVLPGTYSVHASGAVVAITVIGSNLEVRPNVFVPGYALKGEVSNGASSSESEGFDVVLYSHAVADGNFRCDASPSSTEELSKFAFSEAWGHPVCVAKANSRDGSFVFPSVPCGSFVVAPSASIGDETDAYSFKDAYQQVTIDTASQTLPKPFVVSGVSVRGKILSSAQNGAGIPDAKVTLVASNGASFTATTNTDGAYIIKAVPIGSKNSIEVEKKGLSFNKISSFAISASTASRSIPDITVSKFDVCGKVSIPYPPAGVSGSAKRRVSLQNSDGSGSKQTVTTNENGEFCFQLQADSKTREVTVSVAITPFEKDSGLVMTTTETAISVNTEPIHNLHFAQSLLSIKGRINCLGSCAGTRVQLAAISHKSEKVVLPALVASPQDAHAIFEFPLLIPGTYAITVLQPQFCWERDTIEVKIKDSNVEDVAFTQSGYNVRFSTTQDVELHYQLPSTSTGASSLLLKKDAQPNVFCLPTSGTYSFRVASELYKFEKDVYTFTTPDLAAAKGENVAESVAETSSSASSSPASTQAIKLVAKAVKVVGKIIIDNSIASSHGTTAQVEIISGSGSSSQNAAPQAIIFNNEAKQTGSSGKDELGLEYHVWASVGDELKISASSKNGAVLYYPTSFVSKISGLNPGEVMPSIFARPGLFISGSISPALPDVVVTIYDESDDSVVIGNIATDARGTYKAGPLVDTSSYRVSASAPGFHLVESKESDSVAKESTYEKTVNFRASKLGSLTARALDTSGAPIVGALLSLSGAGGYRANNATNDAGEVVFSNIFPGDYYLMPLLKEYTFAKDVQPQQIPKHQHPIAVAVKEGADSLKLIGSRIAYSVFGKVTSLNGQSEKGVVVEARSVVSDSADASSGENAQQLEKATTDQSGSFRIRGLLPGQAYNIMVSSSDSAHIERTSPEAYSATLVGNADIKDFNFLAFRKTASRFEVFGRVLTNASLLQYISVQLFEDGNSATEEPKREIKFYNGGSNFYAFAGLSKNQYTIKVKVDAALNRAAPNTVSVAQLERATAKINFSPDSPSQLVDLNLESLSSQSVVEIPEGQLFATLLVVAIAIGLYNKKAILKLINAYRGASASEGKSKKSKRMPVEDQFIANLNKYGRTKAKDAM